jgi:hypothetical protein
MASMTSDNRPLGDTIPMTSWRHGIICLVVYLVHVLSGFYQIDSQRRLSVPSFC